MVSVSVVISVNDESDFKKSVESISNQTLSDIEVICIDKNNLLKDYGSFNVLNQFNPDELNGKYTYFINSGDFLEVDGLKKCFDACEDNSLDFVQFDTEGKFGNEIYNFNEFKGKTFQLDMHRNARFLKTSFIKTLNEISDVDYLFFWDCYFNAKCFSFINVDFSQKSETDFMAEIENSNRVFQKFNEKTIIGKFKFVIFDWRIELLYNTYINVGDDLKESCYNAYKEDFTHMIYHWRFTDFSAFTKPINKLFFNNIVYSEDFEEFKKLMVQYEIELDTLEVEKQQEIIRKNIKILKNENDKILNSTSWKITEPLRKIK